MLINFEEIQYTLWQKYTFVDDRITKGILHFWTNVLNNCPGISIKPEGVYFKQMEDSQCFVSTVDFLQSGYNLLKLKNLDGFSELIKQYKNPQQFGSNTFEVRCLRFVNELFGVHNTIIAPPVTMNRKTKYPDFKFIHRDFGEIFCECKSSASFNRMRKSRINQFMKKVAPGISKLTVPKGLRVEIFYENLPTNFNKNLDAHLVTSIDCAIKAKCFGTPVCLNYKDTGGQIQYICIASNQPVFFQDTHLAFGIGEDKKSTSPQSQKRQRILVLEKNKKQHQAYKQLFKDACSQLPNNKYSIVFIEPVGYPDENHTNPMLNMVRNSHCPDKFLCCILMYNQRQNIRAFCSDEKKQTIVQQLLNERAN